MPPKKNPKKASKKFTKKQAAKKNIKTQPPPSVAVRLDQMSSLAALALVAAMLLDPQRGPPAAARLDQTSSLAALAARAAMRLDPQRDEGGEGKYTIAQSADGEGEGDLGQVAAAVTESQFCLDFCTCCCCHRCLDYDAARKQIWKGWGASEPRTLRLLRYKGWRQNHIHWWWQ